MTTNQLFQQNNRYLMLRLIPENRFRFCKTNKELIDKIIKEIGICLN